MTRYDTPGAASGLEVNTAVVTPTDRIRWGPVLAGVFAAMTFALVLSTLGAAIGLSAYDRGDDPRRFAIGAGIWGIITMLIAYCFGGWVAARSAAVRGHDNGLLNGAMVAAVGIPLTLFLLGGAGAMVGREASQASPGGGQATARSDSGGAISGGLDNAVTASGRLTPGDASQTAAGGGNAGGGGRSGSVDAEQAARTGSRAAWGTLIALVLAIAASAVGGYTGARTFNRDDRTGAAA
jgi:hypothetical protein